MRLALTFSFHFIVLCCMFNLKILKFNYQFLLKEIQV